MRKISIWATLIFALSVFAFNASAGTKVQVCHIPPDNPTNFHTITINLNALATHLAHGDIGGACNEICATLCDDGDACTVDDIGDCEEVGCPTVPIPADCDDGNPCTTDSCDSMVGCINEPVECIAPNACTISTCATDTGECVDSPIVCDAGQVCNEETGLCENDVECPCYNQEEASAIDGVFSEEYVSGEFNCREIVRNDEYVYIRYEKGWLSNGNSNFTDARVYTGPDFTYCEYYNSFEWPPVNRYIYINVEEFDTCKALIYDPNCPNP